MNSKEIGKKLQKRPILHNIMYNCITHMNSKLKRQMEDYRMSVTFKIIKKQN